VSFFFLAVRLAGGGTAAFCVTFDTAGFLFAGLSSSSESLLLDEAGFLTGCCVGFPADVDFTGDTGVFFFVLSSDESESDEDSFFLLFERLAGGGATAAFLTIGVTFNLFGVDGGCFLLAGGATSSESELELLDDGALRFRSTLAGCAVDIVFEFTDGFFTSSSEDSDEDDESFAFLFPFVKETFGGGTAAFFF